MCRKGCRWGIPDAVTERGFLRDLPKPSHQIVRREARGVHGSALQGECTGCYCRCSAGFTYDAAWYGIGRQLRACSCFLAVITIKNSCTAVSYVQQTTLAVLARPSHPVFAQHVRSTWHNDRSRPLHPTHVSATYHHDYTGDSQYLLPGTLIINALSILGHRFDEFIHSSFSRKHAQMLPGARVGAKHFRRGAPEVLKILAVCQRSMLQYCSNCYECWKFFWGVYCGCWLYLRSFGVQFCGTAGTCSINSLGRYCQYCCSYSGVLSCGCCKYWQYLG